MLSQRRKNKKNKSTDLADAQPEVLVEATSEEETPVEAIADAEETPVEAIAEDVAPVEAKPAVTAKPKRPKKAAKRKVDDGLTGPMRALARGRSYLEFSPEVDEEGYPDLDSVFAEKNIEFSLLESDTRKDRLVSTKLFVDHMNSNVIAQIFGQELTAEAARMLLEGISNECLTLLESGYKVKIPNLVALKTVHRDQRKARNPRTGESVNVPERTVMTAKAHAVAKAYLYDK